MNALRDALSRLFKSLTGERLAPRVEEADEVPDGMLPLDPETDEFADFLDSIGSTDADEDATLRLKDAQIAELQSNLAKMRAVADTLAQTQQARLVAEARVEQLEHELADAKPDLDPEEALEITALTKQVERLERSLEKERKRYDKLHDRFESAREKVAERHRVAAERWHELRRVGRERRALEDRVRDQQVKLEEIRGLLPSLTNARGSEAKGAAARLGELMGEEAAQRAKLDSTEAVESEEHAEAFAKTDFYPATSDDDDDHPPQ